MKLAARIFTALAIAFAISYVAVRDHTPDVSAAAGQIDVLNVGTCYATSSDVFGEDDCIDSVNDTDDQYNLAQTGATQGSGLRDLRTTAKPWATYAVDPKTSSENPRGILKNADLIKVSIFDPGRDRRTPVLLRAGGNDAEDMLQVGTGNPEVSCYDKNEGVPTTALNVPELLPASGNTVDGTHRELCKVYTLINEEFSPSSPADDLLDFGLYQRFESRGSTGDVQYEGSRASNNVVDVNIPVANRATEDFKPLHFKLLPGGDEVDTSATVIRWYGYLIGDAGAPERGGCETVTELTADDVMGQADPKICDLSAFIGLDEDIGSGRTKGEIAGALTNNSPPYITFNLQLPGATQIRIRYVYYETSEREELIGGGTRAVDADGKEIYDPDDVTGSPFAPSFTSDEVGGDALVLRARGDATIRDVNLWLRETDRFTGRYEGYLRLTDENGDAMRDENNRPRAGSNWGMPVGSATGSEIVDGDTGEQEAAVLGVLSGPVIVGYRDTDGTPLDVEIAIDTVPPLIDIESPEYKANFDEQRIEVTGTFTDGDSGLRDDSFRLYLDNEDDRDEDGEDAAEQKVLNLPVDGGLTVSGVAKSAGFVQPKGGPSGVVQLLEDYAGYDDPVPDGLFGVLEADWLYLPLERTTTGGVTIESLIEVDPNAYSDGATEAVFDDIARLNLVGDDGEDVSDLNNQIDFQALVLDRAGNVGFSDSDPAGPNFIHNYGVKQSDRKAGRYNVLGWYARHIVSIDQVDPRLGRVVTGFYGENEDDEPLPNVRGLMLMFDGAVDASSVDVGTFKVELDSVADADPVVRSVADVSVEGDTVYLLLTADFLPDATPTLSVNRGREVRDPAGNSLSSTDALNDEDDDASREIEALDGIPPTFQLALRGGSGTGTGDESSSKLTNRDIIVSVMSDEGLSGRPYLLFVCEGFTWSDDRGTPVATDDVSGGLQEFIDNRSGKKSESSHTGFAPRAEASASCDDQPSVNIRFIGAHSRPGNTWEYQWRNEGEAGDSRLLPDGMVSVVAFGRDMSSWRDDYKPAVAGFGELSYNWSADKIEFKLDSELRPPTEEGFGSVQPAAGGEVFESRPFVLLTFKDESPVSIDSFKLNDIVEEITDLGDNRFLFWPESLTVGKTHKVEVEAVDAAANERDFRYTFDVERRSAFKVELLAGWNAVSVPTMPVVPTLANVFDRDEVDQVVGWNSDTPDAPWRIATKVDGVWQTNDEFAPLRTVEAGKGYWVHSNGFVDQPVMLAGIPDRESAANFPTRPIGISTVKGWNFVGVVDTDGDQTQDGHFGGVLKNSQDQSVTAVQYLREYKQAYTWDPIKLQFNVIENGDNVEIGDGIWVYYADDFNLAP